jgi:glucose/arabinose dehydrogenase
MRKRSYFALAAATLTTAAAVSIAIAGCPHNNPPPPPSDAGGGGTDSGGGGGGLCDGITTVPGTPALMAELVVNVNAPVDIEAPRGDTGRLFIVEQQGTIRIVDLTTDTLLPGAFLDIQAIVLYDFAEQGLLGIAFHPDYANNGRFFVYYSTEGALNNEIAEYTVSATDPNLANPTGTVLLTLPSEEPNHNGGGMEFGPDGLLYIGSGDGGVQGDPDLDSRDTGDPLGKILRLDVDAPAPYIPASNPFTTGGAPSVFAFGFRNPWRLSFDRETGDLYIGDVGQDDWEEISVAPAPGNGLGADFGWNNCEGLTPFAGSCAGSIAPVVVWGHPDARAVIGGYVYRGCKMPGYHGTYFYSDNDNGRVRTFVYAGGAATAQNEDPNLDFFNDGPSSWGEDARGELYLAGVYSGAVYRIVPQ